MSPSVPQGWPCGAGWRLGSGLRGGRDAMWAKHDVFGASLPPCHHLQPQHLPGLVVLTHLLPPRGESVTAVLSHHEIILLVWFVELVLYNSRGLLVETKVWGTVSKINCWTCPLKFLLSVLQTCSNEVKCICDPDYTGKDCSVFDPIPIPTPPDGPEKYKGNHTEQFASTQSFHQRATVLLQ